MSFSRLLPTAILVGLTALISTPLVLAVRMSQEPSRSAPPQKKSASPEKPATFAGFDGTRAFEYLVEQCQLGPRISGGDANQKLRKRMAEHFEGVGAKVTRQTFTIRHPVTGEAVVMENIVASFYPERKRRVVIGAHFDTRPHADKETDPRKKLATFLGANDGASGVAVLMELGNMMKDLIKTNVGVDLVAFDGEELVYNSDDEYFYGSKHFAAEYKKRGGQMKYLAGLVLDMVGGKSLSIYPDRESDRQAPELNRAIWDIARRLHATGFKTGKHYDVTDDHLALLDAGIPTIDIIDFDYKHWHLASDTADKCLPASLSQVGGVVAEWLRGL